MRYQCRLVVVLSALGMIACHGDSSNAVKPLQLFASCAAPAPVVGLQRTNDAPYVVLLDTGRNAGEKGARLGQKYSFEVQSAFLFGFEARLDPVTVGELACEAQVESIQYNDGTFGVL